MCFLSLDSSPRGHHCTDPAPSDQLHNLSVLVRDGPKEDMGYFYETFCVKKRNPVYPDVYPSVRSFLWHLHYEDGFRRMTMTKSNTLLTGSCESSLSAKKLNSGDRIINPRRGLKPM
jgi:hypothetical protein